MRLHRPPLRFRIVPGSPSSARTTAGVSVSCGCSGALPPSSPGSGCLRSSWARWGSAASPSFPARGLSIGRTDRRRLPRKPRERIPPPATPRIALLRGQQARLPRAEPSVEPAHGLDREPRPTGCPLPPRSLFLRVRSRRLPRPELHRAVRSGGTESRPSPPRRPRPTGTRRVRQWSTRAA
jgi:hypothetical protein